MAITDLSKLGGKSKATRIEKFYDWGLYFWRLPSGHLFRDGHGNMLNIPSMRGDLLKIAELHAAAAYNGQPDGEAWFYPGIKRATDEELEEQKARLAEGLIPNLDDLGAVHAAQQGLKQNGDW